MKNLILITLIFYVFGISQDKNSSLTIFSNPNQLEIRLDSVFIGNTPLENLIIDPGTHVIEAYSPNPGLWNSTNTTIRFHIESGRDTTINIRLQQSIKINSIPYHAELLKNDRVLGLTPVSILFEENRGKEFRLEKRGYESVSFTLKEPRSRLFRLKPIQLVDAETESNSFMHSLAHTRLKSKFLFLSGSVLTNWLAFYFKNLADDNYNKYLTTSNPQLMDKYWDKTQKFDRFSDISIGVSYALLGGLIYTVLWH